MSVQPKASILGFETPKFWAGGVVGGLRGGRGWVVKYYIFLCIWNMIKSG